MLVVSGMTAYADVFARMHEQCFDKPWRVKDFTDLLVLPTTVGWVNARGFLLCTRVGDEMEILTIGVLPAFRRCGEGATLLRQMVLYAVEQGVQRIFLEVADDNVGARALYEKAGFCVTGCRKGYYETPHGRCDAICMTKETAP